MIAGRAVRFACFDDPGSHRVAQLAQADGLVAIPAEIDGLAEGDIIAFLPF